LGLGVGIRSEHGVEITIFEYRIRDGLGLRLFVVTVAVKAAVRFGFRVKVRFEM